MPYLTGLVTRGVVVYFNKAVFDMHALEVLGTAIVLLKYDHSFFCLYF